MKKDLLRLNEKEKEVFDKLKQWMNGVDYDIVQEGIYGFKRIDLQDGSTHSEYGNYFEMYEEVLTALYDIWQDDEEFIEELEAFEEQNRKDKVGNHGFEWTKKIINLTPHEIGGYIHDDNKWDEVYKTEKGDYIVGGLQEVYDYIVNVVAVNEWKLTGKEEFYKVIDFEWFAEDKTEKWYVGTVREMIEKERNKE